MRSIDEIDLDIDAVDNELLGRAGPFNELSWEAWRGAKEANPDLAARQDALYLERGAAQDDRDRKAAEAARKIRLSLSAKRAALTRKRNATYQGPMPSMPPAEDGLPTS